MKNLFEVISAENVGSATVWPVPSLSSEAKGKPASRNGRLTTAGHLDDIEKTAREEGFATGHAEGYQAGLRQAQEVIKNLNSLFDHLSRPLKDLNLEVEHALVKLAIHTARKLVNEDLQLHPEHVAGAIHQALAALVVSPREMKIHVNPQDAAALKDILNLSADTNWKLVPDSSLGHGDCRIVTEAGQIDARLDTREANITNALLGDQA